MASGSQSSSRALARSRSASRLVSKVRDAVESQRLATETEEEHSRKQAATIQALVDASAADTAGDSGLETGAEGFERGEESFGPGEGGEPWMVGAVLARVVYFWNEKDYGLANPMVPLPRGEQVLLRGDDVRGLQPWDTDIVLAWDFTDDGYGRLAARDYLVIKKRPGTEWGLGHAWGMAFAPDPASDASGAEEDLEHGLVPGTQEVAYADILRSFAEPAYRCAPSPPPRAENPWAETAASGAWSAEEMMAHADRLEESAAALRAAAMAPP